MTETIEQVENEARQALAQVDSPESLEAFRIAFLGKKGSVTGLMTLLKGLPKEEKPAFGQKANVVRQAIEEAYEAKKAELQVGAGKAKRGGPMLDITEPASEPRLGRRHVISQTISDLIEVFGRMGFDTAIGPELEDEHHNFVALNIPEAHPARDPLDNFYIDDKHLLRSQTSTVQIRVMESTPPPVRIVSLGRVYRPDEHDATHYSMFHQIEGLYVDRNVSMVDLKTTLMQFARAYFGPETEVRLRPSFFPFTEPSAELDIKMRIRDRLEWVELGGCGMVDPNVFKAVGYDPEVWTGWAFGLGVERIAMRRFGISDIRWLFDNDVRFLRQF